MVDRASIYGIVLAGGRSSRMGGTNKVTMPLGGVPLVTRAVRRLSPQVQAIAINANTDPEKISDIAPGHNIIADTIDGFQGPLAGVLAGMRHAQSISGITHIATIAADTPFFPATLVDALAKAVSPQMPIALAASDGHHHPVFGLWPVSLADDLQQWLQDTDTMKVMVWVRRHGFAQVGFAFEHGHDPFFNINTPDDMKTATELLNGEPV